MATYNEAERRHSTNKDLLTAVLAQAKTYVESTEPTVAGSAFFASYSNTGQILQGVEVDFTHKTAQEILFARIPDKKPKRHDALFSFYYQQTPEMGETETPLGRGNMIYSIAEAIQVHFFLRDNNLQTFAGFFRRGFHRKHPVRH